MVYGQQWVRLMNNWGLKDSMLSYRKALTLSPTYTPAIEGLQRVSSWSR